MMKHLSNREKNRRKYLKIYNSVANKLSPTNRIWWDSLTQKARYSFIFKWIQCKSDTPSKKLKHFISDIKPSYRPQLVNQRDVIIEHLIK